MKKSKPKLDWSLTSCCGAKVVKIAGIQRCSKCQRETIVTDAGREAAHMYDVHDWAYQHGIDDDYVIK